MTFWAMNRNAIVLELGPAKAHALEQLASSVARRRDGNPLEPIPGDRCGCCMIATSYRYIVRRAGVRSAYPIVEGTRIGVHDVVGLIKNGAPVDDVVVSLPRLTRAQVYECLAYYADYQSELDPLVTAQTAHLDE